MHPCVRCVSELLAQCVASQSLERPFRSPRREALSAPWSEHAGESLRDHGEQHLRDRQRCCSSWLLHQQAKSHEILSVRLYVVPM
jgi:hypothetical protein